MENMEECKIIDNFGIVCGNYREYFFDYFYYSEFPDEMEMREIQLGDIKVSIGKPSTKILEFFDVGYETKETIKLYGVTEENYEEIIEQVFFYITCKNLPKYKNEYPRIPNIFNLDGDCDEMKTTFDETLFADPSSLRQLSHTGAIAFYNYGVSCRNSELAFIYFYKVLEYFFIINQKNKFKELIDVYNLNNDLTNFINNISEIYKQNEKQQLILLLQDLGENIIPIIERAEEWELIEKKQCKNIKDKINKFAIDLHNYRCSVVHGKEDFKEPIQLRFRFKMDEVSKWISITKDLAEAVIMKFCISQNN